MTNPLSWDYLTAPANETPIWGPFSIAFLIVFGLGFLVSLSMYLGAERRIGHDRMMLRLVRRATEIAMVIFAIGLIFFLFRFLHISAFGLHMRIWLYLSALAAAVMLGYYVYFIRTKLPKMIQAREAARVKQQYLAPRSSRGPGRKRSKARATQQRRRGA